MPMAGEELLFEMTVNALLPPKSAAFRSGAAISRRKADDEIALTVREGLCGKQAAR
jgi:FKBP-type peptidyl-prolyl cis-trans isomerase 2